VNSDAAALREVDSARGGLHAGAPAKIERLALQNVRADLDGNNQDGAASNAESETSQAVSAAS